MSSYCINKIKARRSYCITEIISLLGINRKTCSRWVKDEGLRVVEENVKPLLIMGADLKDFIKKKRSKRKMFLKEDEMFCLKCRKGVLPKIGSGRVVKTGKRIGKENREQFKKTGSCEHCGTGLNKYLGVCQ